MTTPSDIKETETPVQKVAQKSVLRAAGLIAAVTILSKILGFARDWAIMNVYGVSLASDAYFSAFQIPSFAIVLLGGLGGPFNTATVAIVAKMIEGDDAQNDPKASHQKAAKVVSSFMTVTGIIFTLLAIACYLFATPILNTILPGADAEMIAMASEQLKIMSPLVLTGGLVGIFYGVLNVYQSFFWPSFSPAAMSITILAVLILLPADPTGQLLAWATLAGGVIQVLMQLPEFFKHGYSVIPNMDFSHPELKQISELLYPALIGTTIGQLNVFVDMFFASTLNEGGWTAVVMSNRLIQLPIGVLQTALLVPIFPMFASFVAQKNWDDLKKYFKTGVISLWLVSLPLLGILILYTKPLIQIVFEHGNFDARGTELVTLALLFQAFQMIPYFARDSLTRVFYAFQDAKTPLYIGMAAIGLKAFFDWLFVMVFNFDVGGITFSTTLVTFTNMVLLGILVQRHIKDLGFKEMLMPFFRLFGAATVMTFTMAGLSKVLAPFFIGLTDIGTLDQFLEIMTVSILGLALYAALSIMLKIPEAEYIYNRVQKLIKR